MKNFLNKDKNSIFLSSKTYIYKSSIKNKFCNFGIKLLLIIVFFSLIITFQLKKTDNETYTSFENGNKLTYCIPHVFKKRNGG